MIALGHPGQRLSRLGVLGEVGGGAVERTTSQSPYRLAHRLLRPDLVTNRQHPGGVLSSELLAHLGDRLSPDEAGATDSEGGRTDQPYQRASTVELAGGLGAVPDDGQTVHLGLLATLVLDQPLDTGVAQVTAACGQPGPHRGGGGILTAAHPIHAAARAPMPEAMSTTSRPSLPAMPRTSW